MPTNARRGSSWRADTSASSRNPFAHAADLLSQPDSSERHPTRDPASLALAASSGLWRMARHLDLLNQKLVKVAQGTCKRLMVFMPPRHGKSEEISRYFPAWYLGTHPNNRIILASYEATFAATWGRKAREVLERFEAEFGVRIHRESHAANRWDIEGHEGGMVTAGVGGAITGKGAHVLIIDDPVKNAEEAASQLIRDRNWDWWRSTAYTRLEPDGAVILVQTRWHEDDLAGRILERSEAADEWEIIRLPAIAEADDQLGRAAGEALWPDRFSLAQLEAIKLELGPFWWAALYQQRPIPELGGGFFPRDQVVIVDAPPADIVKTVLWWDIAGTKPKAGRDPDYTAGVVMAKTKDNRYCVLDVIRFRENPAVLESRMLAAAGHVAKGTDIWIPQDPGAAGVIAADYFRRRMTGYNVRAEKETGSKSERAKPFSAQWAGGNVSLVRGSWNAAYISECEAFPFGTHDDQVDASSGAFSKLARPSGLDYVQWLKAQQEADMKPKEGKE